MSPDMFEFRPVLGLVAIGNKQPSLQLRSYTDNNYCQASERSFPLMSYDKLSITVYIGTTLNYCPHFINRFGLCPSRQKL